MIDLNAIIEALRGLTHELVPVAPDAPQIQRPLGEREAVGRALLDLPPEVWRHPVVRDYCAADARLALLAQWPGEALVQWARAARATLTQPAGAAAALYYTGQVLEDEEARCPLCDAAREVWRRSDHASSLGDVGWEPAWDASMFWVSLRANASGTPAFESRSPYASRELRWHAALDPSRPDTHRVLRLGVWWHDGVREVRAQIGPRLAGHLDALSDRRGTPDDLRAVRRALQVLGESERYAHGWLSAHLCATRERAALYLAALLRGHLNPVQGLAVARGQGVLL